MDKKWRQWNKLEKEPEPADPLPGWEWVDAVIDVYGTKLPVKQLRKIKT